MTERSSEDSEPTDDPLGQSILPLDEKQTREFLEVMHNPRPANEPLKAIRKRTPPCSERTQIENVFGLLERKGQRTVSIQEMDEAAAERAVKDDERIKKG